MSHPSKQQFRLHAIVAWVSYFRAQEHHSPQQRRSMQEQVIELLGYLTSYIEDIFIFIHLPPQLIRLPPQLIHPFQHINRNSINQQLLHQIVYNL
mmetsp:Transcript_13058/g.19541  ORF Transcript_13058/g.19541 Transcript_13058/m.19541 type:complete len:95 (+) Transcript_13058:185-469(+)